MGDENTSVSRETPPPPSAVGVFAQTLPVAIRYADLLADQGVLRGLIGPREVPRLWERHLVNCALLGRAIEQGADVCDVGSGAGLPGLVLALSRPDLSITLVEPLLRRATFLQEAVDLLGLGNVEVTRARAEELHGDREFSVVTARAVAPLDRLLGWCMPLVREGGELVAMKGSSIDSEIAEAEKALRRVGGTDVRVEKYGGEIVDPPTVVVRVRAGMPSTFAARQRKAADGRRRRATKRREGR